MMVLMCLAAVDLLTGNIWADLDRIYYDGAWQTQNINNEDYVALSEDQVDNRYQVYGAQVGDVLVSHLSVDGGSSFIYSPVSSTSFVALAPDGLAGNFAYGAAASGGLHRVFYYGAWYTQPMNSTYTYKDVTYSTTRSAFGR